MGESVLTGSVEAPHLADAVALFADAGLERVGESLHFGGVPLSAIADGAGTPAYVYNAEVIGRQFRALDAALAAVPHGIAYAVKANANLAVLRILRDLGAGADIVSGGELARALAAGFEPERIVFSGVGKSDEELTAAVEAGIGHVHLESTAELAALGRIVARAGRSMRVGIRVNPDVTADTHPFIATGQGGIKFGVPVDQVVPLARAVERASAAHPRHHRDAHRQPAARYPAVRGGHRPPVGAGGRSSARPGSAPCGRSTSGAASASGTGTSAR